MAYTAEQLALIHLVEFRADQLTADGQQIGANYERIYEELEQAAKTIIQKARREFIYKAGKSDTITVNGSLTKTATKLTIPMPTDFLRFLRMECSHLNIPIDVLLETSTKRYRIQSNPNSQADAYRPAAFIIPHASDPGIAIELYPGTTALDPVTTFLYVPETLPENMPDDFTEGMTYWAAASVLLNERSYDAAKVAMERGKEALSGLMIGTEDEMSITT